MEINLNKKQDKRGREVVGGEGTEGVVVVQESKQERREEIN
jgi:hypothetical protein